MKRKWLIVVLVSMISLLVLFGCAPHVKGGAKSPILSLSHKLALRMSPDA